MWAWTIPSLILVALFGGGFGFGWFLWRSYFLAVAPALVIAVALWIRWGWLDEPSGDFDRSLMVVFYGLFLAVAVVCWALGAALGMILNLRRFPSRERASSSARVSVLTTDCTPAIPVLMRACDNSATVSNR